MVVEERMTTRYLSAFGSDLWYWNSLSMKYRLAADRHSISPFSNQRPTELRSETMSSDNESSGASSSSVDSSSASSEPEEMTRRPQEAESSDDEEEDLSHLPIAERLARSKPKARKDSSAPAKRRSKHAPAEVSSRKAQKQFSGLGMDVTANLYKPLDPRLSSLHGHLNMDHVERNYEFVEDMRKKEILQLKKRVKDHQLTGRKGKERRRKLTTSLEEDQAELQRLQLEQAQWERQRAERSAKRTVKKKTQGYFPKRSERKRLELEVKFEELRKKGGKRAVQKAMEKRRKKNKSRDAGMLGK